MSIRKGQIGIVELWAPLGRLKSEMLPLRVPFKKRSNRICCPYGPLRKDWIRSVAPVGTLRKDWIRNVAPVGPLRKDWTGNVAPVGYQRKDWIRNVAPVGPLRGEMGFLVLIHYSELRPHVIVLLLQYSHTEQSSSHSLSLSLDGIRILNWVQPLKVIKKFF